MTENGTPSLFTIDRMPDPGSHATVLARIQADHAILQGHFPGRPVVPGVCLVDLVVRICSALAGADQRIIRARSIKFLQPVEPVRAPELLVTVDLQPGDGCNKAEARIAFGETVAMKMTADLVPLA